MGPYPQVLPRILPDSFFFRSYSQILFQVWRKNELSSVKCLSPWSFKFFHRWFNLSNFNPGDLNNLVVFLIVIPTFEDRRRVPLKSCPFFQRFMVLALCHPLIIVLIVRILFTHLEQFKILFSLFLRRPSSQNLFILSFQLWFSKSYRCFVQVISNQFLISLFSCI